MAEVRRALLARAFSLLYGPLAWLHELAGRLLSGSAWNGRRALALDPAPDGLLLDLGCGEGRLLALATQAGIACLGVDPSRAMTRRARRRGVDVVRGDAIAVPLLDGTVSVVTSTYPGDWIYRPAVMDEIGRVLRPGGEVRILLGGAITRGRLSTPRRLAARVVYGRTNSDQLPALPTGNDLEGGAFVIPDRWGESLWWIGRRAGQD